MRLASADEAAGDLRPVDTLGRPVHQRGEALASTAQPAFRDRLRDAAARAGGGRSPFLPPG
ncbi:MAG: hypothetical protein Q8K58_13165 [Acidimicrobiales bacterium]|nr:hypothetical protein [Acidimicrobiales bacterium]